MAVQAQASVCACWFAGMAKASNSASVPEMVKCIKANLDSFELVKESDPEKVVALYKDFLVDLLELTSRPLKPLLTKSLLKAFERVPKSEAEFWANQIVAAVQIVQLYPSIHGQESSGNHIVWPQILGEVIDVVELPTCSPEPCESVYHAPRR